MSWLWPIQTGQTFFDTWSICHLCFWIVYGYNYVATCLKRKAPAKLWQALLVALIFAYAWECFEGFVLEPHGWVMFKEVWFNRWLSDPLMAVVGTVGGLYLVRKQQP
jgi:hypothetical protein